MVHSPTSAAHLVGTPPACGVMIHVTLMGLLLLSAQLSRPSRRSWKPPKRIFRAVGRALV